MKNKILEGLRENTHSLVIEERKEFTASYYADELNLSRNVVSQYLNEWVKKNEVIKINTRPVYFFSRKELEERFNKTCSQDQFQNFEEFLESLQTRKSDFEELIGYDNSLHSVVEHCKAAVAYPENGLPILVHGPTGTGKSMIASLMYNYAVHHHIIDSSKKFVAVNCSEYANNPELLTSNLFGYVKGAYTGADSDNQGLIALADGGILFLDEVHCLKAECQEKLFFFMDKGIYHKVGDNENWYTSSTRIIFATTEDPQNTLLKTLLRRIPITVTVPALKDRPLIEKRQLISSIFKKESRRLHKKIEISNLTYQTLMDFEFSGNVGEMKNAIKATCANAFLSLKDMSSAVLPIHVQNLPSYIFQPLKTVQTKTENSGMTMLPIESLEQPMHANSVLLHMYEMIMSAYEKYTLNQLDFNQFIQQFRDLLQNYIDYVIYHNRYRKNVNDEYVLKILDKIYSIVMNKYSIKVPNSEIQVYAEIMSEYSKHLIDARVWISSHNELVNELVEMLKTKRPRDYSIAYEVMENISLNLDIELDEMLLAILTVSFISYERMHTSNGVGVILCHGYSTASSLAATANRLLNDYIFDGIDMQIDLSIDKVAMMADEYLKQKSYVDELMLLVDMGSLEEIYKRIKPITQCNIGLMNNVSTKMALEVGMGLKQGKTVQEIIHSVKKNYELSTHYIEGKEKPEVIISVCATGFGAAKKISELLLSSLQRQIPVQVIPYEYQSLAENGIKDSIFNKYDVKLIIGTLDPNVVGVDFIPVEGLMMNEGLEKLNEILGKHLKSNELHEFHQNMMKNFTLSNMINHLTILNAEKIIDDVEEIVEFLEEDFNCQVDPTRKVGLYVHLSCLIERLILKNEIQMAEGMEKMLQKKAKAIEIVNDAFSGVKMRYSVELPSIEALYVLNYFDNIEIQAE